MTLLSPLYEQHKNLNAVFTDFSKWEMPLHYGSIINEHMYVREKVGLFDISHMGVIFVRGSFSTSWLDSIFSNDVKNLKVSESHYTFILNENFGVIDDVLLYRLALDEFFIVVNASNTKSVNNILEESLPNEGVEIENKTSEMVSMAIQGSDSLKLIKSVFLLNKEFKKNELIYLKSDRGVTIISCTGYTGTYGFEIFTNIQNGINKWSELLNNKCSINVFPCGLGCRDTLRIEAGYPLYGNELTIDISPKQAGLSFFVKKALKEKIEDKYPKLFYFKILEKSPPPRKGYQIYEGEELIGLVTSGCLSPKIALGVGFALIDVPLDLKESFAKYKILIRNKKYNLKFIKRGVI